MASVSQQRVVRGSVAVAQTLHGRLDGRREVRGSAYVVPSALVKCDGDLSDTSTAPVENRVVTAVLAEKVGRAESMTEQDIISIFHS